MEVVRCVGHGSLCFLKTGVRDGPSRGKSFYVCGVQDRPPCAFVAPTELPPSHCLIHEKYVVELQVLIQQQDREEYRLFYRCLKSKKDGKRWCGSIPWQNPKTSQLPTDLGCHHAPALLCNPNGPRNPFKVLNKNCEVSSWKQINEDTTEKNTAGGGKQKAEKAQALDAKEKLTSESVKGRELSAGMKITKKQSGEKKTEAGEEACSQTKSSQPETQKEGNLSCDGQKHGTCKEPAKFSKHAEKAASATLVEDVLSGEGNRKPLSSCPKSQKADAALLREEQLRKECSIAHEDKWIKVEGHAGEEICEKNLTARQSVISQKTSTTSEPSTSVFMPPGGPPAQAAPPKSGIVPRVEKRSSGHSGTNEDEVVFVSPTLGESQADRPKLDVQQGGIPAKTSGRSEQNILSNFPGLEISLPKGEALDFKDLHSHLQIQLKQKKSTLAAVNVQALPDKGERLLKQVQDLEAALSTLNLSSAEREVEENTRDSKNHDEPLSNTSSSPGTEPTNIMQLKKQQPFQDPFAASSLGLHCHGPVPSLGSSKYYGHVYGVNSSMQNLYGGRMTEDRIKAVRDATSDAIDHLYKSLESCPTEETVAADPSGLRVSLLVHQKQALAWLLWRESQRPCGGILADDMGLGKTLTMIALILTQKNQAKGEGKEKKLEMWLSRHDSPVVLSHGTLIICPASLLHHWKKEIERHVTSGKLRIYLYHGPNRSKDIAVLSKYDIVVTTYGLISKEVPTKKEEGEVPAEDHSVEDTSSPCSSLLRITWARIILDEAHNIKNPKAQTSLALCRLRANARWAVTGTPIQNNLLDMYSLLRFLRCSPFDEFKVWKYQVDNGTVKGGERLSILTRNLLLRRTKDQLDSTGKPLVSLPQRHAQLHQLKLSEDEQSVYNVLFARSRSTLQSYLKRQEQKSQAKEYPGGNPFDKAQEFGAGQKDVSGGASQVSSTVHVLSMLLRLRQCCCHLSLLKMALDQANLNSDGISLSLEEQLSALTLSELQSPDSKSTVYLNGTAFNVDLFEVTRQSTKISHLLAELKAIQSHLESQKSVIVSQWTSMLKVVAIHLERLGLKYVTIDGSVNPKERMDVVEEFNMNPKGPQVMLLSLIAGGIGLNLTGGNHLFLLDMHWNPALEDQACDRIYRVGQQKDVVIHRFVCEGTVEEKISELQTKKKNLAQQVLSGTGDSFTKLTLADLKIIFGI
ncbi:transcription termination factor 2 isoform X1 [Alligator mississippiensis]|uniref:transcription termination factor 2 isoform X1 n=1 Tax=Alligator mississippiensis TaxID=8496 RepID=UPI002877A66B|nr:transcription termination factor 2 isoform X1 [Alligator mississippiensis]